MSSSLSVGIVGLPNVGKSTFFNALTAAEAGASNYPFCTIDPNVGVVEVPDSRLKVLSSISKSGRIIPASMKFVDIAGLVAGASKGEGLGNKFLANIRETDAIVHVVRCFDDDDVVHVAGRVDPINDIEVINTELALADLQMAENIIAKLEKQVRGDKKLQPVLEVIRKVKAHLEEGLPVRSLELSEEDKEALESYHFITGKRVLYVANVSESDLPEMNNEHVQKVRAFAEAEGSEVIAICAKLEEEIQQLDLEERQSFLADLGLEQSGLERVVRASFEMLGLISFLTTGEMETRAWPIRSGMNAAESAGKIHTDIQKGFIRAEVISYVDMVEYKGRVGAREAGKMRAEGREYIVKDGDVILFLHN
ncbi:MAG: redox-regulated ATPase YchF [Chlamydiia bacterium]|nr:redox-regulated ATPase YchF [Chlamydiia bacterium]